MVIEEVIQDTIVILSTVRGHAGHGGWDAESVDSVTRKIWDFDEKVRQWDPQYL